MIPTSNDPGILVNSGMTFLDVNVRDPIMHDVNGDHYTTYDISIETNNSSFTMPRSAVRRRFSEFIHLRSLLKELQPSLTPPRLPSRTIMKRFDDKFIEERRSGLESFLRDVLMEPLYLSNKGLHLFIQTSLTMKEIEDAVKGTEGTYMPESKPPIVLALHDEVFDEIGDSAYESAAEDSTAAHATATEDSATAAPRGITRKTSSVTMLHSSKCCRGDGHFHLRIGSSICVCTPTLMPPSWEGSQDRSSSLLQSLSCPLPATSTPIAARNATSGESRSMCTSPDFAANKAARMRTSVSDSCLETLGGMKKHVSFSSAVEILDRVSECHGCSHLNLPTPPSAFDDDRSSTSSSTSSPRQLSDSS